MTPIDPEHPAALPRGALTVTDSSWNREVADRAGRTVVVFLGRMSTPCRDFARALDDLGALLPDGTRLLRLDIHDNPLTPRHYGVTTLPTVLVFSDGVPRGRLIGTRAPERLWRDLSWLLV